MCQRRRHRLLMLDGRPLTEVSIVFEDLSMQSKHTLVMAGSGAAKTAVAKAKRASVNCILAIVENEMVRSCAWYVS